jgi:hypothetical protein
MRITIRHLAFACLAASAAGGLRAAHAGGPHKYRRAVVETAYVNPANANAPSPMLGSMYPVPTVMIAGDRPTGFGYSPLGQYGPNNLNIYGPTSIYRTFSAPVRVYNRGYNGAVYETEGTAFSTPNFPPGSPVVYPGPNSSYYRPRRTPVNPIYTNVQMWIDQN